VVHVASLQRSRGDEAEDGWVDAMGCIRLFSPNFAVFVVAPIVASWSRTQGV
jgi:hypothetical protein